METASITHNSSIRKTTNPFIFQQIYELFAFLYKYIQSFFIQQTAAANTKKVRNNIALSNLQYYKEKTLVLDLDETLVHSVRLGTNDNKVSPSIKKKTIEVISDQQSIMYEVYKRPHVDFFLSTVNIECKRLCDGYSCHRKYR